MKKVLIEKIRNSRKFVSFYSNFQKIPTTLFLSLAFLAVLLPMEVGAQDVTGTVFVDGNDDLHGVTVVVGQEILIVTALSDGLGNNLNNPNIVSVEYAFREFSDFFNEIRISPSETQGSFSAGAWSVSPTSANHQEHRITVNVVGQYFFRVTFTFADGGIWTISRNINGDGTSFLITTEASPLVSSARSSFTVNRTTAFVGESIIATATLRDQSNNPIPESAIQSISFEEATPAGIPLRRNPMVSQGNGVYTYALTSSSVMNFRTGVFYAYGAEIPVNLAAPGAIDVQFVAPSFSLQQSSLSASPQTLEAGQQSTVTATMRDEQGGIYTPTLNVLFSTERSSSGSNLTASTQPYLSNGQYQNIFTNTVAEPVTIRAGVNSSTGIAGTVVTWVPAQVDAALSSLEVVGGNVQDPSMAVSLKMKLKDRYGNTIFPQHLDTSPIVSGRGPALNLPITEFPNDGFNASDSTYTFTVPSRYSEDGGIVILTGLAEGITLSDQDTILYKTAVFTSANSDIQVSANTATVGDEVIITVTSRDQDNVPYYMNTSQDIGIQSTGTQTPTTGFLGTPPYSNNSISLGATVSNNLGTYTKTISNTLVDTFTIKGRIDNQDLTNMPTIIWRAGAPSGTHSIFTAPASIDISETATVGLTLRDIYGNVITDLPSETISILVDGTPVAATRDADGVYRTTVSQSTAGDVVITAQINGNNIDDTKTITFIDGDDVVVSNAFRTGFPAVVGTMTYYYYDLKNSAGAPITASSMTFVEVDAQGNQLVVPTPTIDVDIFLEARTGFPSNHYITLLNTVPGTFYFDVYANGILIGSKIHFTWTPIPALYSNTVLEITPDTILGDGMSTAIVRTVLKDRYGNTVFSGAGNRNGYYVVGGTVATFANGSQTSSTKNRPAIVGEEVKSTQAGDQTITLFLDTAANGNYVSVASAPIHFSDAIPSLATSTLSLSVNETKIFNEVTATITMYSADGDLLFRKPNGVTISLGLSGSATVVAGSERDNRDGTYSFRITDATVEDVVVTANINGSPLSSGTETVAFVNGDLDLSKTQVSISPTTLTAGSTSTYTLTFYDEYDSTMMTPVKVRAITDLGTISNEFIVSVDGIAQGSVRSTVADTAHLEFFVDAQFDDDNYESKIAENYPDIIFTSTGFARSLTFSLDKETVFIGDSIEMLVQLIDGFSNVVPDARVVGGLSFSRHFTTLDFGSSTRVDVVNYGALIYDTIRRGYVGKLTSSSPGTYSSIVDDNSPEEATVILPDGTPWRLRRGSPLYTFVPLSADLPSTSLSLSPNILDVTTDTATVTIQMRDRLGNDIAVNNNEISLKTTLGMLQIDNGMPSDSVVGATGNITGELKVKFFSDVAGTAEITTAFLASTQPINNGLPLIATVVGAVDPSKTTITSNTPQQVGTTMNVIVALFDANNNQYSKDDVTVSVTLSGSVTIAQQASHLGGGRYLLTLIDQVAETVTIQPILDAVTAQSVSTDITFSSGDIDLSGTGTEMTISKTTNVVADSVDLSTITVQLKDRLGNLIKLPNYRIQLIKTGEGVFDNDATTTNPLLTDANGIARTSIRSVRVGTATISFSVAPPTSGSFETGMNGSPETVTFIAGAALSTASNFTVTPSNLTVLETAEVRVQLYDAKGNLVNYNGAQHTILVQSTGTGQVIVPSSQPNSYYTVSLANQTAEIVNVTATLGGNALSQNRSVTFTAGTHTARSNMGTVLSVSKNAALADGVDLVTVTVQLQDTFGNLRTDSGVPIVLLSSIGTLTSSSGVTSNGTYQTTLKSSDLGTASVTATSNSISVQNGSPQSVVFGLGSIDFGATGTLLTINPDTVQADGSETSTLSIQLKDARGRNLSLANRRVYFSSPNPNDAVTFSVSDKNTDANGFVTGVTVSSTVIGLADITVRVDTTSTQSNVNHATITTAINHLGNTILPRISFVQPDISVASAGTSFTAFPTTVEADGVQFSTLVLQLKDEFGNNISKEVDVQFTFSNSADLVLNPSGSYKTNVNGRLNVQMKSTRVGSVVVSAKIDPENNNNFVTVFATPTVNYTIGAPSAANSTMTVQPTTINASDTVDVTVTLFDSNSPPNQFTTGGNNVTITPTNGATVVGNVLDNNDGTYSVRITSQRAGDFDVTATLNSDEIDTQTVTVNAGLPSGDANASEIQSRVATAEANGIATAEAYVILRDEFGNSLNQANIPVQFVNNTSLGTLVPSSGLVISDASGEATIKVTSSTVGATQIIAILNAGTLNADTIITGSPFSPSFTTGAASVATTTIAAAKEQETVGNNVAVTITLRDANGFLVSSNSEVVALTLSSPTTSASLVGSVIDNGDGTFSAQITNQVAEQVIISGTLNNDVIASTDTVTFVPGAPSVSTTTSTSFATADKQTVRVDVNANEMPVITVEVRDEYGNAVNAATAVSFSVNNITSNSLFNPTFSVVNATTSNGSVTSRLSSNIIGTTSVMVEIDTDNDGVVDAEITDKRFGDISFTAGDISVANSGTNLSIIPDRVVANGISTSQLRVQLRDNFGNPVTQSGIEISFTKTFGDFISNINSAQTNTNGLANVSLVSNMIGQSEVTASIQYDANKDGVTSLSEIFAIRNGSPDTVNFISGGFDESSTTLVGTPTGIVPRVSHDGPLSVADGVMPIHLVLQLKDVSGNNVSQSGVQVRLRGKEDSKSIYFYDFSSVTDANGQLVVDVPYNVVSKVTFDAIIDGDLDNDLSNNTSIVSLGGYYSNADISITQSTITVDKTQEIADDQSVINITVTLIDDLGFQMVFGGDQIVIATQSSNASISSVIDRVDGTYNATIKNSVVETDSIFAYVNGTKLASFRLVDFITGAISLSKSILSINPTKAVADGTSVTTATVQLKDDYGNLLSNNGTNIEFQINTGSVNAVFEGSNAAPKTVTSINGLATVNLTSLESGIASVSADISTLGFVLDPATGTKKEAEVEFVPGAISVATSGSIFEASPLRVNADGTANSVLNVQLRDANSNVITTPNVRVYFFTNFGDLDNSADFTNSSGNVSVTLSSDQIGLATIYASIDIANTNTPSSASRVTNSNSIDVDFVDSPDYSVDLSQVTVSPTQITAGDTATVTVTLLDPNAVMATTGGENVIITPTAGLNIVDAPAIDNGDGTYTIKVTATTSGRYPINAELNGQPITRGTNVQVVPSVPSFNTPLGTRIEANPLTVIADGSSTSTVSIQLKDEYGNIISGLSPALLTTFTSASNNHTFTSAQLFNSGVVTSNISGTVIREVQVSGVVNFNGMDESVGQIVIDFVGGDVSTANTGSLLSAAPSSVIADGVTSSTVSVQLRDVNGQNLSRKGVRVNFVNVGNKGVLSSPFALSDDTGLASVRLTNTRAEVVTVTAQIQETNGNLRAVSNGQAIVNFTPGRISLGALGSTILAAPDMLLADGSLSTVTVQLKDEFGNEISNGGVSIQIITDFGLFANNNTAISLVTQSDGTATTTIRSLNIGTATLRAEIDIRGDGSYDGFVNQNETVQFMGGDVSTASTGSDLSASINTVQSDNTSTSSLTVQLRDVSGNTLDLDNYWVYFNTSLGVLLDDSVQTINGIASTTIKSSSTGNASVTANIRLNGVKLPVNNGSPLTINFVNNTTVDLSKSTVVASPTLQTVGDDVNVTVTLRDVSNNPILNSIEVVSLSLTNSGIVKGTGAILTNNGDGTYTGVITDTVAEIVQISAFSNGAKINSEPSVVFSAGPVSFEANGSEITRSPEEVIANGTSASIVTLTLKDKFGNNINNAMVNGDSVHFYTTHGRFANNSNSGVINSGSITAQLNSGQDGVDVAYITAEIDTDGNNTFESTVTNGVPLSVRFVTGDISTESRGSLITADKNSVEADGVDVATISVQLQDDNGNPISQAGIPVQFAATSGNFSVSPATVNTDASGRAIITLSNTQAIANVSVTAEIDKTSNGSFSMVRNGSVNIDFVSTRIGRGVNGSELTTDKTTVEANGTSVATLSVQLKTDLGVDITTAGVSVRINANSNNAQWSIREVVTNNMGVATTTIFSTVAEVVQFTAEIANENGLYIDNSLENGSPLDITFTSLTADEQRTLVEASPKVLPVGDTSTVIISLRDKDNNPLTASGGSVTLTSVPSANAQLYISAVTDNNDGTYTAKISNTVTGPVTIEADIAGKRIVNQETITFTVGEISTLSTGTTVLPLRDTIDADGVSTRIITIQLKDEYGNDIQQENVNIKVFTTAGDILNTPITTNAQGVATTTLRSSTSSTDATVEVEIDVKGDNNFELAQNKSFIHFKGTTVVVVEQVVDFSSITGSTISVDQTNIDADGSSYATVTVLMVDVDGNTVTDKGGIKVSFRSDLGTFSDETRIDATGRATARLSSDVAGTASINAYIDINENDNYDSLVRKGNPQSVIFNPYLVSTDIMGSELTVSEATITADGLDKSIVRIALKDKDGNAIARNGILASFSSNLGTFTSIQAVSDINGIITSDFTGLVADTAFLRAEITADNVTSFVLNGDSSRVILTAGAVDLNTSLLDVSKSILTVGDSSIITVTLYDANNNRIETSSGSVTLQISPNGFNVSTVIDNGNGIYTAKIKSTDAQSYNIVASLGGSPLTDTETVDFVPSSIDISNSGSIISTNINSLNADSVTQATVTVRLRDEYGNTIDDDNVRVKFASSSNDANMLPANGEVVTMNGVATIRISNHIAEQVTVTAKIDVNDNTVFEANENVSNGSAVITFNSGDISVRRNATQILLESSSRTGKIADSVEFYTIAVQLKDRFQNEIKRSGVRVEFNEVGGGIFLGPKIGTTDSNGKIAIRVVSKIAGQNINITANVDDDLDGSINATVTNGSPQIISFIAGSRSGNENGTLISATPLVVEADNNATSTISLQLKDKFGNDVHQSVAVSFESKFGIFSHDVNNTLFTNPQGFVETSIRSGMTGVDTITAKFDGDTDNVPDIEITNGSALLITFSSGAPSVGANGTEISATSNDVVADGVASGEVTVTLRDAVGNINTSTGYLVEFTTDIGSFAPFSSPNYPLRTTQGVTTNGISTVNIYSTDASRATITARLDTNADNLPDASVNNNSPARVNFIPGNVSIGVLGSEISASPTTVASDGNSTSTIILQLRDKFGNIIAKAGSPVIFSTTVGTLSTSNISTNAQGVATVTLTSTSAGMAEITARVDTLNNNVVDAAVTNNSPARVTFEASNIDLGANGTLIYIDGSNTAVADSIQKITVKVQLRDINANEIKKSGVQVRFDSRIGQFSTIPPTVLTNNEGIATILVSSKVAGQDLVTAEVDVSTSPSLENFSAVSNGSPAQLTFIPGPVSVEEMGTLLSVSPTRVEANGTAYSTLRVMLMDKFGNQVKTSNIEVEFISDLGTVAPQTPISVQGFAQTNTQGIAEARISSSSSGVAHLVAKIDNDGDNIPELDISNVASDTVVFASGVIDVGVNGTEVTINPKTGVVADDSQTALISVQLKDSQGNNIDRNSVINAENVKVSFVSSLLGSSVSPEDVLTNQDGIATARVKSTSAGLSKIIVSIDTDGDGNTDGEVQNGDTAVTFISGSISLLNIGSRLTISEQLVVADDNDFSEVTVELRDVNGNVITRNNINVRFETNLGTFDSQTKRTDNNGRATVKLKSTTTGIAMVRAQVDVDNNGIFDGYVQFGDQSSIEFIPGPISNLSRGSQITAVPNVIEAGGLSTSTITVQLKDQYGNNIERAGVRVRFDGGNSLLDNYSEILTGSDGTASVNLTSGLNAEIVYVTARVQAEGSSNLLLVTNGNGQVTITAGSINIGSNGTELSISRNLGVVADGNDFTVVQVQLKDRFSNNIARAGVRIQLLTSDFGTFDSDILSTNPSGNVSARLSSTQSGTTTISAQIDTDGDGTVDRLVDNVAGSNTVQFVHGSVSVGANGSRISVLPTRVLADGIQFSKATVEVRDQYGNLIRDESIKVRFETTLGTLSNNDEVSTQNGIATVFVRSVDAGIAEITAQIDTDGVGGADSYVTNNSPSSIEFYSGSADFSNTGSELLVLNSPITAHPDSVATVTLQLKDSKGNNIRLDNNEVVFAQLFTTLGDLSTNGLIRFDQNGRVSVNISSEVTGDAEVTAMVGNIGQTSNLTNIVTNGSPGIVRFIAGPIDFSLTGTELVASPTTVDADGIDFSQVTVQLKDTFGNNVPRANIGITLTSTFGTFESSFPIFTDGDGIASARLKSSSIGTAILSGSIQGNGVDVVGGSINNLPTPIVNFVAGSVSADVNGSYLSSDPRVRTADGIEQATVNLQLRDRRGNNVLDATMNVRFYTDLGTLSNDGIFTVANNGSATVTITSKKSGVANIGAVLDLDGDGIPTDTIKNITDATVSFEPGAVDITKTSLIATPTSVVADDIAFSTIAVQLNDSEGNPVTSSMTVAVSILTNFGNLSTANTIIQTNTSGYASAILSSGAVGTATLQALIDTDNDGTPDRLVEDVLGEPVRVTFVNGIVSDINSTIQVAPRTVKADGLDKSIITVQLRDSKNQPITTSDKDFYVRFETTLGLLSTEPKLADQQGKVSVELTGTDLGQARITAYANLVGDELNNQILGNSPGIVDFIPGDISVAATGSFIYSPRESGIVADGIDYSTIYVQLKDSLGHDITGDVEAKGVRVQFYKKVGANGVLEKLSDVVLTDNQGIASVQLQSMLSTFIEVFAVIDSDRDNVISDTVRNGIPLFINFNSGAVSIGENGTSLSASPTEVIADGDQFSTITLQLRDAIGSVVERSGVKAIISSSIGIFSNNTNVIEDTTDANGRIEVLLRSFNVGTASVTAVVDYLNDENNLGQVINGLPVRVIFKATGISTNGIGTEIASDKSVVLLDGLDQAEITVQLRNERGEPILTDGVAVQFASTGGTLSNTGVVFTTNGITTVYYIATELGLDTITAFVDVDNDGMVESKVLNGNPLVIEAKPGTIDVGLSGSELTVNPRIVTADGIEFSTITLQLKDALGNNLDLTGINILFNSTIGDLSSSMVTTVNGIARVNLRSTIADTVLVRAIVDIDDNGTPEAPVQRGDGKVIFISGDISADVEGSLISIKEPNPAIVNADGLDQAVITLQLQDKFGNAVKRSGVNVQFRTDLGLFSTTDIVKTNAEGIAQVELVSNETGTARVSAEIEISVDGILDGVLDATVSNGSPATVEFVSGKVSVGPIGTSITSNETILEADGIETAKITVQLKDDNGKNITKSGIKVLITTNLGFLTNANEIETDANGTAFVFLSSLETGTAEVNALVDADDMGVADDMVTNNAPALVIFTPKKPSVGIKGTMLSGTDLLRLADGIEEATLIVQLRDENGNNVQVAGYSVTFQSTLGTYLDVVTTDMQGQATTKLTSLISGVATITATVDIDQNFGTPEENILNGSPVMVSFSPFDSDGDGILNDVEVGIDEDNPVDTDSDGLPDYLDTDSDNDAKLDESEGESDCDTDGIANYVDNDDECKAQDGETSLVLTLNGDDINSFLSIGGIEQYTDNVVEIYNRWGAKVWTISQYDNNDPEKRFSGIANVGGVSGGALRDGTYFYIVEWGDGSEPSKLFFMIIK